MQEKNRPITPQGFAAIKAEYDQLFRIERPKVVEIVSWAAGNGDRSENGDYIYGKQKLRSIDYRLGQLSKSMKAAHVIDPANQPDKDHIYFGAQVALADEDDNEMFVTIVGDDESDADLNRIGWSSPLARALRRAAIGDVRQVNLPSGPKWWEVIAISY